MTNPFIRGCLLVIYFSISAGALLSVIVGEIALSTVPPVVLSILMDNGWLLLSMLPWWFFVRGCTGFLEARYKIGTRVGNFIAAMADKGSELSKDEN